MKQLDRNEIPGEAILLEHIGGASPQSGIDYSLFHEIILFPSGDVDLLTESIHICLKPNTLVLIPKGTYHQFAIRGNKENCYWCRLLFDDIPELQSLFIRSMCQLRVLQANDRINVLFQILQDMPPKATKDTILIRSVLALLLNEISRSSNTEYAYKVQNEVVQQAVNYVKENLDKKLTLSDIAKVCKTSESALSHIFKREMNQSLYKYIIQIRLTTAHKKIDEGVPAKIAAYSCGFNDYSAFYRQYKKVFGFAPSQNKTIY